MKECIDLINTYSEYKLTDFQEFIHAVMVGIVNEEGKPIFDTFFIYCGRGFGKNSIASDGAFYLMSNKNGIKKYNIEIVANNEEQAKTSFLDNYNRINDFPRLKSSFKQNLTELTFRKTNSRLKFHTSNSKTKDGLRPGAIIFDEVHEYMTYENIKVFTSALGKVKNPRTIILTTDGYVRGGVLDDYKEEANNILTGVIPHGGFLPFIMRADNDEEWETEEAWIKANRMLLHNPYLLEEYRKEYKLALKSPQMRIEFMTKRLNRPVEDITTAVTEWENILATNQEIPDLTNCDCIPAIDYADFRDFVGVGLLFKKESKYYWIHHTFVTQESLNRNKFKIPIQEAINQGLMTVCKSNRMNPELVVEWFLEKEKTYRIRSKIKGDLFRLGVLKEAFKNTRFEIDPIRNGYITHNKLAPQIDLLFANHQIVYGDDFLMRWYTNNVKVVTDGKGNKSYQKQEPILRKTDGFMAFVAAFTEAETLQEKQITYNRTLKSFTY